MLLRFRAALTVSLVGILAPVFSLSAKALLADSTPLGVVVQIAAEAFSVQVSECGSGKRIVTGRFEFASAEDVAAQLAGRGFPVQFAGGKLLVGCDASKVQLASGPDGTVSGASLGFTAPLAAAALGGPRPDYQPGYSSPSFSSAPSPPPPPPPPTVYRNETIRYRDPQPLIAALSKLPGLSVIADPKIPGPLLLGGPASIVETASRYIASVDTCPAQVQIEAAVISETSSAERSRSFGLQLSAGDSVVGSFNPLASATISIPNLKIYLDALRDTGEFRQNSSLKSRVLLGETVRVQDGQDVPIRAATSVTAVETRQDVIYRSVGHRMEVTVLALDGDEAILKVDHELSAQTGNGQLGPVFTTRAVTSTMRVTLGTPAMVSLSGADVARKQSGRGIFSRSDSSSAEKAGAFLVFALERLGCSGTAAGERQRDEDRADTAGTVEPLKAKRGRS